jgi:predicted lipoprotein with Yx(FWY)xxD motif
MVRKPIIYGCAAATLVLLAGCGSSKSSSSPASAPAPTPTVSTPTAGTSATAPAGAGLTVTSKHGKLGTILAAGPKKMTVYLFEGDNGASSACSGSCASVWPPVTGAGNAAVGGQAVAGDLASTTRSDGTKQVTYKGHPLYFYAKDKDSGDAYGQGIRSFGADWYVLKPSGSKLDTPGKGGASGS